jgi:hypothetical protein
LIEGDPERGERKGQDSEGAAGHSTILARFTCLN